VAAALLLWADAADGYGSVAAEVPADHPNTLRDLGGAARYCEARVAATTTALLMPLF
jgi:hypothetical protein